MEKMLNKWLVMISIIAYSIVVVAYVHATFPTMPMFSMLCDQIKVLDSKLDTLIWLEMGKK
jgi:hypothetical protein